MEFPGSSARIALALLLFALASAGCAGKKAGIAEFPSDCWLDAPPGPQAGRLTVEIGAEVDSRHAPIPTNAGESMVFAQLYETLVKTDCGGELLPGLAIDWESTDGGASWEVELRKGLRFSDGSALRPRDVLLSWRLAESADPHSAIWIWLDSDRLKILGDRRFRFELSEPIGDFARVLAHPSLAIASPRGNERWPLGTGPYRVVEDGGGRTRNVNCQPNPYSRAQNDSASWSTATPASGKIDPLVFAILPGTDPRDLALDRPVARRVYSRDALEFFSSIDLLDSDPLPWERRYTVLWSASPGPNSDRAAMSELVVSSDARAASQLIETAGTPQFVPQDLDALFDLADSGRTPSSSEILYPEQDPEAERLAARIASVSVSGTNYRLVTRALSPEDLEGAVRSGSGRAIVWPLPPADEACGLALARILRSAPWLLDGWDEYRRQRHPLGGAPIDAKELVDFLERSGRIVPLVEIRPHWVRSSGLRGTWLDRFGVPNLGHAGWDAVP